MTEKHDGHDYPIGWDLTMAMLVVAVVIVAPVMSAWNKIKKWVK